MKQYPLCTTGSVGGAGEERDERLVIENASFKAFVKVRTRCSDGPSARKLHSIREAIVVVES